MGEIRSIMVHGRESEEQNQDIREDKELVLVQLRKLKAQRTQARGISQENLVKLTLESNATLKALRKIVDKVTKGRRQPEQNQGRRLPAKRKGLGRHRGLPPASCLSAHLECLFYSMFPLLSHFK